MSEENEKKVLQRKHPEKLTAGKNSSLGEMPTRKMGSQSSMIALERPQAREKGGPSVFEHPSKKLIWRRSQKLDLSEQGKEGQDLIFLLYYEEARLILVCTMILALEQMVRPLQTVSWLRVKQSILFFRLILGYLASQL
jgi:hypothetical protein